jgi:hypothetical protein
MSVWALEKPQLDGNDTINWQELKAQIDNDRAAHGVGNADPRRVMGRVALPGLAKAFQGDSQTPE